MIRVIASCDPQQQNNSKEELERVKSAVETAGHWDENQEWRISTWLESRIVRGEVNDRPWFTVTVSCDGQIFSCGCPSVERAYGFMRFYQALIVDQYYSVGPPWVDHSLFQPRPESAQD